MGMFDWVNHTCRCPICGYKVTGFQSKDGRCYMGTVEPDDVESFYSSCDNCETWIEYLNLKMIEPNIEVIKKIKNKEDCINYITHDDKSVRDYCYQKIMPLRRYKNVRKHKI